jgi:flagellar hook-associated protein 2
MRIAGSTSSTSSANTTLTSGKRLTGLLSGLDTDALVKQMTAGTQNKIDKQMQTKQLALWRQDSYRQVTTALSDFKTKYFSSSSSSSNIANPNFFNSTSIKNTSPFVNISGNTSAAKNMVITEITNLAKQASFVSNHNVSNQAVTTGTVSSAWKESSISGSSLVLNYGGKDYTLEVSSDFAFPSNNEAENKQALANELNKQIAKTDGLKGIVQFGQDGKLVKITEETGDFVVKDGGDNLLKGLGLTKNSSTVGSVDTTSLYHDANLKDALSGATLTFSLNGLSKNITFSKGEEDKYSDPNKLKDYLQEKLNSAYGNNAVSVNNNNGKLSFNTADFKSVLSINSSDKIGVLGKNGALRVYAGETNRINTQKTLADVQDNLGSKFTLDSFADPKQTTGDFDAYGLTINGKKFTFKSTATIADVISTVNNDADANVTISYSQTNDTFSVSAKNGGSTGKVDITESESGKSGLAEALFGKKGHDYTITDGENARLKVSFDGNPANAVDIVRSDNKFTLDGVNFELLGKTDNTVSSNTPIKFIIDNKTDDLYAKIKGFVDDYNALIDLANGKTEETKPTDGTYAPLTEAQKAEMTESEITTWETKAKKGLLNNDSILQSLSLDLRHSMTDQVESLKSSLYQVGIATKANDYSAKGKLTIDETALKNALNNDPEKVSQLFTGKDGIASRMQGVIDKNIKTSGGDGILVAKAGIANSTKVDQSSITRSIKEYETQIKKFKTMLATQQEQYYAKFTKLEQYLSTMNSQASVFSVNTTSS